MPRRSRVELAGGIHHVTSRGNNREPVFHSDADRRLFIAELERAVVRQRWACLGYCLMTNHFHLVLETPEPNLGAGMRPFLSRFVQVSNQWSGRDGHRFKERFDSVLVQTDQHFACLLRYIALNPVNAGLCRAPWEWRWSSHSAVATGRESALLAVGRIEDLLGVWGAPRGERYSQLLAEDGLFGRWSDAIEPNVQRPRLAELLDSMPRDEAMRVARYRHGYRVAEIARAAGLSPAAVSRRTRAVAVNEKEPSLLLR